MNKLFLIGNGFDLAHGMKTSYQDFALWYLNKTFANKFKLNVNDVNELVYFDSRYNWNVDNFHTIEEFYNFIKTHKISVRGVNSFVQRILDNLNIYNWVDIEGEYYYELVELYKELERNNFTFKRSSVDKITPIDKVKELNRSFSAMREQLVEYLLEIKNNNGIVEEIDSHLRNELINISLKGDFIEIQYLNFNYTSTIDLYVDKLVDINNIHGKLTENDNPIIFGYGDEMDSFYEKMEKLNKNEYLKNMKSFSYFKTRNYRNLTRFINSGAFDVCIMGHSCGLSDRLLLNSIFEHNNCHEIKIFYYEKSDGKNDFFEKTQEISRHFRPEFKNEMRKKIIPFDDCLPLVKCVEK